MMFKDDDFRFEWFSGTGKGGQHRNKHQNCCRCIHIATGTAAVGSSSRSREDNKQNALAVCKARVERHFHEDTERYRASEERVRTYHESDNYVLDHASGARLTFKEVFEKDGFDEIVDARAKSTR